MDLNWTGQTNPSSLYFNKDIGLRVVVGITCVLAMLGAMFVILSYVCFKDFRTQARQILLNLSLMDFSIGLGNVIGILINFDRYYLSVNSTTGEYTDIQDVTTTVSVVCQSQAVLSHFVTMASVLWTVSLSVYMFILITQNQQKAKYFMPAFYVASYGMPALVCSWLLATNRFGYSPYNSAGWCSFVVNKPLPGGAIEKDYLPIVIGYDLWIYLAILVTAAIYGALFLFLKEVRFRIMQSQITFFFLVKGFHTVCVQWR